MFLPTVLPMVTKQQLSPPPTIWCSSEIYAMVSHRVYQISYSSGGESGLFQSGRDELRSLISFLRKIKERPLIKNIHSSSRSWLQLQISQLSTLAVRQVQLCSFPLISSGRKHLINSCSEMKKGSQNTISSSFGFRCLLEAPASRCKCIIGLVVSIWDVKHVLGTFFSVQISGQQPSIFHSHFLTQQSYP